MNSRGERALRTELIGTDVGTAASEPELHIVRNLGLALRRGAWLVVFTAIVGAILGLLSSTLSDEKYTSVAHVMIDTRVSVETEFTPTVSGLPTSVTVLESELEVLRSLDLIERVVDRFDLINDPEFGEPPEGDGDGATEVVAADEVASQDEAASEDEAALEAENLARILREKAVAAVAGQRTIEQVGNVSAVFAISFTTIDPVKSARLANALAQEYLRTTTEAKLRSLELSQGWLTDRTRELQVHLTELGVELEQHLLASRYSLEEVETVKAKSLGTERRLNDATATANRLDGVLEFVEVSRAAGNLLSAARRVPAPSPELAALIEGYDPESPASKESMERALAAAVSDLTGQRDQARATSSALSQELSEMRAVLNLQARHDAVMHRIENDIAVSESIYQDFMAQLSRRTQQERFLEADARVIASARPALDPSEPKRKQAALIGAVAAAFAAILALAGSEIFQVRLRTVREYEEMTGLPLIGAIPEVPNANRQEGPAIFVDAPLYSSVAMRYPRKLCGSILAMAPQEPGMHPRLGFDGTASDSAKIIAGVAANPDEGLSQAMFMLAMAFSEAGERVLLVDLDFWSSPYPSRYPDAEGKVRASLNPDGKKHPIVKTSRPLLDLLPAFARDPHDGAPVTHDGLAQILEHLSDTYDRILLDTAPLLWRPDAVSLCRTADMTLLFVRWNTTERDDLTSAMKLLRDVGVQPAATVATRLTTKRIRAFGERALSFPGERSAGKR